MRYTVQVYTSAITIIINYYSQYIRADNVLFERDSSGRIGRRRLSAIVKPEGSPVTPGRASPAFRFNSACGKASTVSIVVNAFTPVVSGGHNVRLVEWYYYYPYYNTSNNITIIIVRYNYLLYTQLWYLFWWFYKRTSVGGSVVYFGFSRPEADFSICRSFRPIHLQTCKTERFHFHSKVKTDFFHRLFS